MPLVVPQESTIKAPSRTGGGPVEEWIVYEDVPAILQQAHAHTAPAIAAQVAPAVPTPPIPGAIAPAQVAAPSAFPAAAPATPLATAVPAAIATAIRAPTAPGMWPGGPDFAAGRPFVSTPAPAPTRLSISPELVMSYIFVHRNALFAPLLLFALLAGLGFWVGYSYGVQQVVSGVVKPAPKHIGVGTLLLKGSITYDNGTSRVPDQGAAVIAMPKVLEGGHKLSGWKGPSEPGPPPEDVALAVHDAGGDLAIVSDNGTFEIVVPRAGLYDILIISAHARRPSAQLIQKQHLDEMVTRFESPSTLIGWQQYEWLHAEINLPSQQVEHVFPASN